MTENKKDIFYILSKIDAGNSQAFDEFEKEFSPYMAMKWLSGTKNSRQILLNNQLLNSVVFALSKEKKLLYYLSCCITDGKPQRYSWIKRPSKPSKELIDVVSKYYGMSYNEAVDSLKLISKDNLIEMATEMGYTEAEIKKLKSKKYDP